MTEMRTNTRALLPVMLSFFVMGFVDITGIAVSYVKTDFGLSDTVSNLIPMMVFLWFAILSIPVGKLMGKIGRRKTVIFSAALTVAAMLIPAFSYSFGVMLAAFAMLGIANTVLQVSLNPLVTDVVPQGKVTGSLALGQFIKAISSTLAPVLAGAAAAVSGSWKTVFFAYAAVAAVSGVWLAAADIKEAGAEEEKSENVFSLLKDRYILMLFSVILLSVGFEIGLMTAVPKFLAEKFGLSIEAGGMACSVYYIARTTGTFAGSLLLSRVSTRKFQSVTLSAGIAGFVLFFVAGNVLLVHITLLLIGLCCANIFAATLGEALRYKPAQANGISALMITGVAGGAVLPPVMGVVADLSSQAASLSVPFIALVYMAITSFKLKK